MQLMIEMKFDDKLVLPIGHHHILQSMIYHNLKSYPEYSRYLHDLGYSEKNRQFKMFTFGPLRGRYQIQNKEISFTDTIKIEIRSPEPKMIRILGESVRENGVTFGSNRSIWIRTKLDDKTVEQDKIHIRMLSPITVRSTDPLTKKTTFYNPDDPEFSSKLNDNFTRKYKAFYGVEPTGSISIEPVRITVRDRYVTKYQGFFIFGWLGDYVLTGERKYLDFLYQTGLGEKNAQGFGMFEIMEDRNEEIQKGRV